MKNIFLVIVILFSYYSNAQNTSNLYTIVRKNTPNVSLGAGTIRLGTLNLQSGIANNIGISTSPNSIVVTGGALNALSNQFNVVSGNGTIMTYNTINGNISEVPINSFNVGSTFFDNVSFCNSNNTLYGLARTFNTQNQFVGMYLASLNTTSGNLTALSQNSIGNSYQLAGKAINPNEMVYYFSTGVKFMGIDLYNGSVYSNPNLNYFSPNDGLFSNFTYNCNNATIYGLVVEQTTIQNPNAPPGVFIQLMRLATINTTTGLVKRVGQAVLPVSSYSLSSGSTIKDGVYYFNSWQTLHGISIFTGQVVSSTPITYEDGQFVEYLSDYNYCLGATFTRLNPALGVIENEIKNKTTVFPNPTSDVLNLKSDHKISNIEIYDAQSRKVKTSFLNNSTIDVKSLESGIYFIKFSENNKEFFLKFVKI